MNSEKRNVWDIWTLGDEKLLTTNQNGNERVDRLVRDCAEEVPMIMHYGATFRVLRAVSSEMLVMSPHFFGPGRMVFAEAHTRVRKAEHSHVGMRVI